MNTNIDASYEYLLQQMAAESYFEGLDLKSELSADIAAGLRLGANRIGYLANDLM